MNVRLMSIPVSTGAPVLICMEALNVSVKKAGVDPSVTMVRPENLIDQSFFSYFIPYRNSNKNLKS